jgi:dihydroorotate dehydrogenase electron transfer subunit
MDVDRFRLHFFFQQVGQGTRLLAQLSPGDKVAVWGPLGNGFDLSAQRPTLILAGGMGLAPFIGLIRHHPWPKDLELLFGHRQPLDCYPFQELATKVLAWSIRDQGPADLQRLLHAVEIKIKDYCRDGSILACGPLPFLRFVHQLALKYEADTQLSLETRMACGIGACLGCSIPTKAEGQVQVCSQGPVFRAESIDLSGAG